MEINGAGNLSIGGCDTVMLAKKYGTPLYVVDEQGIRENCRRLSFALAKLQVPARIIYAGKAFLTLAICRIMQEEGMGLDLVSGGELHTAVAAKFPMEKVCFHGNNKSYEELELAITSGVGRIVVDNYYELEMLGRIASHVGVMADILIRVTPGVSAHTHEYIQTGQEDSKFGFGLGSNQAREAALKALAMPAIRLHGFHCHIGSQIFNEESFELAIDIMTDFVREIQDETEFVTKELNLGGGWGIRYVDGDNPMPLEDYVSFLARATQMNCQSKGLEQPLLIFEPGRALVGEMGTTLYTVGAMKDVVGHRRYLSVDGGMGDNPRYALYQAEYEAELVTKIEKPHDASFCIVGKCCESGDVIIKEISLPPAEAGDILAVFCTGAYNYSMSSNYNRLPRPAAVLVEGGEASLIIQRETYDDLLRNDILPERLGFVHNPDLAVSDDEELTDVAL
jgi:diaminopimelate decarboxylase